MFADKVPTYFDNAVVDLFAIGLQSGRECDYSYVFAHGSRLTFPTHRH
jgi:hypothetical protein